MFTRVNSFVKVFCCVLVNFVLTRPFGFLRRFDDYSRVGQDLLFNVFGTLAYRGSFSRFKVYQVRGISVTNYTCELTRFFYGLGCYAIGFVGLIGEVGSTIAGRGTIITYELGFGVVVR